MRLSSKRAPARANKKPAASEQLAARAEQIADRARERHGVYTKPNRFEDVARGRDVPQSVLKAAGVPEDGGGMRFNAGKVQLELIPMSWTWALGQVLTRGAAKYAARNWERGMAWSYPVGCALRHMIKFAVGERYDRETGCHHLAMAAWNMLALMTYDLRAIGTNDLGAGSLAELEATAIEPGPELAAMMQAKITATVKP